MRRVFPLLLAFCFLSACDKDEEPEPDTTLTDTAQPDTSQPDTSPPDTSVDTPTDTGPQPLVPLPSELTLEEITSGVTGASGLIAFHLADIDGDNHTDLLGLEPGGKIILARFDPTSSEDIAFEDAISVTIDIDAALITTGHFDAEPRLDLAVLDPATGKGRLITAPARAFDNPLVAFDNPLVAFDNPLVAFDNPLVAVEQSWAVADFDHNGLDDIAFLVPDQGVSVGFVSFDTENGFGFDLQQPPGLSDFSDPAVASPRVGEAIDLDGDGDLDLVIGFELVDNPDNDAMAPFIADETSFDNPLVAFDNPLVAADRDGFTRVTKGLTQLAGEDLNLDGQHDLVWMSSPATTANTHFGVLLTTGFDNPLVAFDNPLVAFDNPLVAFFEGTTGSVSSAKLLLPNQQVGFGGGGPSPEALPINAASHIIFLPADASQPAIVIPVRAGTEGVGQPISLSGVASAFSGAPIDFNGDGFSEFVGLSSGAVSISKQALLFGDPKTDTITLEDGTEVLICQVSRPFCDEGRLGICAYGRKDCIDTCTEGPGFAQAVSDTRSFADLFESTESLCDGFDNDCDGTIDILTPTSLDMSQQLFGTPASLRIAESSEGVWMVFTTPSDGNLLDIFLVNAPESTPALVPLGVQPPQMREGTIMAESRGTELVVLGESEFGSPGEIAAFNLDDRGSNMTRPLILPTFFQSSFPDERTLVHANGEWRLIELDAAGGNLILTPITEVDPTPTIQSIAGYNGLVDGYGTDSFAALVMRKIDSTTSILEYWLEGVDASGTSVLTPTLIYKRLSEGAGAPLLVGNDSDFCVAAEILDLQTGANQLWVNTGTLSGGAASYDPEAGRIIASDVDSGSVDLGWDGSGCTVSWRTSSRTASEARMARLAGEGAELLFEQPISVGGVLQRTSVGGTANAGVVYNVRLTGTQGSYNASFETIGCQATSL